jgi:ABC-type multidrug transport system ATPase subunit
MTGLLQIVDKNGDRSVELSRTGTTIGSGESDSIVIQGENLGPSLLTISWDSRRATWVLNCPLPLGAPVVVNRRTATPGEQIPLANLDVIEVPGAFLKFERLLARPSCRGRSLDRIPLNNKPLAIGRGDPQGTTDAGRIDLDNEETTISRVHALIEPEGQDYVITDQSRRGMELNGVAFTREHLVFGDRLRISGYIFEFTGDAIRLIHPESSGSVSARNLSVVTASGRTILDQFSVNISAGEFVGVLGGSGQGKSTLLNALCGINPPTSGEVRIGGVPLSDRARLREIGIGFVPQDDIVHKELTVTDAISFSARLRLRLPRHQIDALVLRVITRLGLAPFTHQRIADLSGGQRKRVSIAIELLAKPSVLFLDEPSSGLDPATEEALMTLLQSLTLTKLTVICTTHVLQKAYLFDRILFVQGGKLVFAGHTDEARRHFLLQSGMEEHAALQHSPIERIYVLLANSPKPAAEWEREFRSSAFASRAVPPLPPRQTTDIDSESSKKLRVSPLSTFLLLATRQWQIVRSDFWNLVFLVAQPVLIGFLIGWVADKSALRMFLCVVATMWFGCSNGAQQIVGELPIFRRERVSGQGLNAYVLSKLGFLSLISLAQAAVLLMVTLFCSQVIFHPEKTDSQNLEKEFALRLVPESATAEPSAQDEFTAMDTELPDASSTSTNAPAESAKKSPSKAGLYFLKPLLMVSRFFQVSQNIIDSGPRVLTRADGMSLRDAKGREIIMPGTSILNVLLVTLGLRWLAVAAAAVTGVSIGLMISSLVSNTTQAVLWVPLILIPQILFGGIVVTVADMSSSVRTFSHVMPSFAAQRIMDVASLYGLMAPFLTNRTKTPLFLTSRGDKETVEWEDRDQSFSQSYDKLSPVNTSWQNMAIIPQRLGQHKQVGERSESGFRIEYRDTVERRRDVRYSKGTVFRSLVDYYNSLLLLSIWIAVCYVVIFFGLLRKQTGK